MLNWGDKDIAEKLAVQLKDLLRDRTMSFDQLASCYSIKNGQSVTQRLKEMSRDRRPMTLGDFIMQMADHFESVGQSQVRARTWAEDSRVPVVRGMLAGVGDAIVHGDGGQHTMSPSLGTVPATQHADSTVAPVAVMKYADVSRGVQNILKEQRAPIAVEHLENLFLQRFGTSISDVVGLATGEYLQRKEAIFDYQPTKGTVFLQSSASTVLSPGPQVQEAGTVKDESFVVREFEQLIEAMGPVVYISTLCGKFIQRNGLSVTSVISARPLDLFKRHPSVFLIVGAGNVTLKKFEHLPDVQRLLDKPSSKAQRIAKAAEEAQLPVPEVITEQHVVQEFRRLILADATDSVYISSLCGRFLQRFKKPVTAVITGKPAEFLRRYPNIFVMTGGGNVGLREVLGPDAVSVPPPPPRVPKAIREDMMGNEIVEKIQLTDQVFEAIHAHVTSGNAYSNVVQRLRAITKLIEQASFLALEEVVLGGSIGKELLVIGPHIEIVLVVRQLPFRNFPQWLPHILDTLSPVLEYQLASQQAEKFRVEKDHLQLQLHNDGEKPIALKIFLSPSFRSREHMLDCIRASPPAERFYFYPAMVKERNHFVARQPQDVKSVIHLMSWWASRQPWTSTLSTPPDWLLELIAIHVFHLPGCQGLGITERVQMAFNSCRNFVTSKVQWDDTGLAAYQPEDIWRPLLSHEPLFMDPLNPYCNLADVNRLDSREMMVAAQTPSCFIAFKRYAAQFLSITVAGDVYEEDEDEEDDDEYADAKETHDSSD